MSCCLSPSPRCCPRSSVFTAVSTETSRDGSTIAPVTAKPPATLGSEAARSKRAPFPGTPAADECAGSSAAGAGAATVAGHADGGRSSDQVAAPPLAHPHHQNCTEKHPSFPARLSSGSPSRRLPGGGDGDRDSVGGSCATQARPTRLTSAPKQLVRRYDTIREFGQRVAVVDKGRDETGLGIVMVNVRLLLQSLDLDTAGGYVRPSGFIRRSTSSVRGRGCSNAHARRARHRRAGKSLFLETKETLLTSPPLYAYQVSLYGRLFDFVSLQHGDWTTWDELSNFLLFDG